MRKMKDGSSVITDAMPSCDKQEKIKGQAIPFMLVMIVVLVISWAMMLNIAKLLHDRMIVQNAADNAAYSYAVSRARMLNQLGELNYYIAYLLCEGVLNTAIGQAIKAEEPIGLGTYTKGMTWDRAKDIVLDLLDPRKATSWMSSSAQIFKILAGASGGGITAGPYGICPSHVGFAYYVKDADCQTHIGCISDLADNTVWCSGIYEGTYVHDFYVNRLRETVKALVLCQDFIMRTQPGLAMINAEGIARRQELDSKGNPCGPDVIVFQNPLKNILLRNENGINFYKTRSACVSIPDICHIHSFWLESPTEQKGSWLYADRNNFAKSLKIRVIAKKRNDSKSRIKYPIFGKLLGIKWPEISATAAASVYNTKGPMFPLEENGRPSDRISPVYKEYNRAKHGGWYAHLVPVGAGVQH